MTHHTTLVQRCRATNSLLADELAAEFRRLENDRADAADEIEKLKAQIATSTLRSREDLSSPVSLPLPGSGQEAGPYSKRAARCYDTIVAFGWEITWRGNGPVPDDAWPKDVIRREIESRDGDWVPLAKALFEVERDPAIKDQAWFDFQSKAQRLLAIIDASTQAEF